MMMLPPGLLEGPMGPAVYLRSAGDMQISANGRSAGDLAMPSDIKVGDSLFVFNASSEGSGTENPSAATASNWTQLISQTGFPNTIYHRVATGDSDDDYGLVNCSPTVLCGAQMVAIAQPFDDGFQVQRGETIFFGGPRNACYRAAMSAGGGQTDSLVISRSCRNISVNGGGMTFSPATDITDTGFMCGSAAHDVGANSTVVMAWSMEWQPGAEVAVAEADYGQSSDNTGSLYGGAIRCIEDV